MDLENNSGQGKDSPVLNIVKDKFNWGAFYWSWLWGIFNNSFITLIIIPIAFIPVAGALAVLGLQIWFGIKGNEWAWQNKRWQSIDQFHEVQKSWAISVIVFTLVLLGLAVLGIIASLTLPAVINNSNQTSINVAKIKQVTVAKEVVLMNEALENKCQLTSNGLAACFANRMNSDYTDGNSFNAADGSVWTFNGDGNYNIKIDVNGIKGPNVEENDIITVPLYVKSNGYLEIKEEDIDKYITK